MFIIHTLMGGILSDLRRYLALCVGETRVRIDLLEPVTPRLPQSPRKDNEGKLPLSPSTLHFLSQVHQLCRTVLLSLDSSGLLTHVKRNIAMQLTRIDTSQAPDLCSMSFSFFLAALSPYRLHQCDGAKPGTV